MKSLPFFVGAVGATVISFGLVTSHQDHATTLAQSIIQADVAGADTTASQQELATYIKGHTAAAVTYTLAGSYNRAAAAAQAAATSQSNGGVYAEAQASCAGKADSIVQAKCVQAYVAAHASPQANPQAVAAPKQSDYVRSLTGPTWTTDSVGLTLLAAIVFAGMGVFAFLRRK